MASAVATVPVESDFLCEACGYVLNGLPSDCNCPECGISATQSAAAHRGQPAWERPGFLPARFLASTLEVLFRTHRFYRTLATRTDRRKSRYFAILHILLASLLFGITGFVHVRGFGYFTAGSNMILLMDSPVLGIIVFTAAAFLMLGITTPIAGRLTSWEAKYRGLRLPLSAVLRGLDYHAAHYLPVAGVAAITVVGYRSLLDHGRPAWISDAGYLYVLCGEVIVGAVYLFWTYWIGMRNMMYANA